MFIFNLLISLQGRINSSIRGQGVLISRRIISPTVSECTVYTCIGRSTEKFKGSGGKIQKNSGAVNNNKKTQTNTYEIGQKIH